MNVAPKKELQISLVTFHNQLQQIGYSGGNLKTPKGYEFHFLLATINHNDI